MIASARRVAPTLIVAVFMTYVVIGRGLHAQNDGMKTMHGAGVCLILFALAAAVAAATFRQSPPRRAFTRLVRLAASTVSAPVAAPTTRARASPALLQVFRR